MSSLFFDAWSSMPPLVRRARRAHCRQPVHPLHRPPDCMIGAPCGGTDDTRARACPTSARCACIQHDGIRSIQGVDVAGKPEEQGGSTGRGEFALDNCALLIGQIACPVYCCTQDGAVRHANHAARRLWGSVPDPFEDGRWDGFTALYTMGGNLLDKSASPAALAARGGPAQAPVELLAESADGQRRCVVLHARSIRQDDGATAGVLCSVTDINEQRRFEAELRAAHDDRAAFLHVLAHELRNPLAPVMAAGAILQRQASQPNIAGMGGVIVRQTGRLARFLDDLLEGSRIEQALDTPVSMRATNVREVLAHAFDVVESTLRERGQSLRVERRPGGQVDGAVLWCDPERLGQALACTLLNASQFSDDGAGISLNVAIDGVFLELLVSDPGIGVEADDLPLLFEPFRQFTTHPGRVVSGAGLGLAIARSVARAHGGMVSAHSAGPGQGTRLKFVLPVVNRVPA